jgi:hypothetical protein
MKKGKLFRAHLTGQVITIESNGIYGNALFCILNRRNIT